MNGIHNKAEALARQIITDYGLRASIVAVERLNQCLDRGDQRGRDDWIQVIYLIHRLQRGEHPIYPW